MKTPDRYICCLIVLFMLFLQGCYFELQHSLDEVEANEILLLLLESGLKAEKSRDSKQSDKWMICVEAEDSQAALQLLIDNELPRQESPGFSELFAKEGLVPSEMQQTARYVSALAGELQKTLESDDSVLRARVHIHTPSEKKSRFQKSNQTASASVYLKLIDYGTLSEHLSDTAIKTLVSNSVANLDPENVSVVKSLSRSLPSDVPHQNVTPKTTANPLEPEQYRPVLLGIIAAGLMGFVLIAFALIRSKGGLKLYRSTSEVTS